jgi:hypothetical protein
MRISLVVACVALPVILGAQEQVAAPAGPPLGAFAAERVAIVPLQYWRADTSGWSASIVGARIRPQVDSVIAESFRDRGMGTRWSYAADAIRGARRNPTYSSDPTSLGVGRWRSTPPAVGDALPALVADNLRLITALGDTRYALIPVELRAEGGTAVLRLVLADTRLRTVVWLSDVAVLAPEGMLAALGARVADLVLDP